MDEGLDLLLCHLLPKAHKEVAQLGGGDQSVALLQKKDLIISGVIYVQGLVFFLNGFRYSECKTGPLLFAEFYVQEV